MREGAAASAKRIAAMNDRLRREPNNRELGQVLISEGIVALGEDFKRCLFGALAAMTPKDFKRGNDPYRERDFNAFSVDGRFCLFKIDYYAKGNHQRPSDDPADPGKTDRVLTLMLADDY